MSTAEQVIHTVRIGGKAAIGDLERAVVVLDYLASVLLAAHPNTIEQIAPALHTNMVEYLGPMNDPFHPDALAAYRDSQGVTDAVAESVLLRKS